MHTSSSKSVLVHGASESRVTTQGRPLADLLPQLHSFLPRIFVNRAAANVLTAINRLGVKPFGEALHEHHLGLHQCAVSHPPASARRDFSARAVAQLGTGKIREVTPHHSIATTSCGRPINAHEGIMALLQTSGAVRLDVRMADHSAGCWAHTMYTQVLGP